MPCGDRTGPMGMGPMSGRGAGFCADYTVPGFRNAMPRGGMAFGRGCGRGFEMRTGWGRRGRVANGPALYSQVDLLSNLKSRAKYFTEALQSINSRISELEAEKK